jgi:hypothetical protein
LDAGLFGNLWTKKFSLISIILFSNILSQIYYHYNSTKKVFGSPSSISFFYIERNRILCWFIPCMKETLVQIS